MTPPEPPVRTMLSFGGRLRRQATAWSARWAAVWSAALGAPIRASEAAWLVAVPLVLLIVPAVPPNPPVFVLGLPAAVVVLLLARIRIRPMGIVGLFAAGVALRAALAFAGHSDVLAVTAEAIGRLRAGVDPWAAGYRASVPPGAPLAYGPAELAWYLGWPFDLRWAELGASLLVLAGLAVRGRPLGLAVYALSPLLALVASDGSNDTGLGLVLLVALLAARRSRAAGGVLLAIAAAFKLDALAWLPALAVFAGPAALGWFAAASLAAWAPPLVAWGAAPIADSIARAGAVHAEASGTVARTIEALTGIVPDRAAFEALRLVLGSAVALGTLPMARRYGGFLAAGAAVFLVTLYAGYWASFAYLAALAPIICWELDELAGLGARRVRLPGDIAGRVEEWVERKAAGTAAAAPGC